MKKTIKRNFRVIVTPRTFYKEADLSDCEEIAQQIKRHVDNVLDVHAAWDNEELCEHCDSEWTEDGDYNGGCCEEDEKLGGANE